MAGERVALGNAISNFLKSESESYRAASIAQRAEFQRDTIDAIHLAWEVENLTRLHKVRLQLQEQNANG